MYTVHAQESHVRWDINVTSNIRQEQMIEFLLLAREFFCSFSYTTGLNRAMAAVN